MVPSLVLVVTPTRLFWGPPEKSPHRRDRGRRRPKKLSRDCQKASIFIFGNRTKRVITRLDIARAEPDPAARRLRLVRNARTQARRADFATRKPSGQNSAFPNTPRASRTAPRRLGATARISRENSTGNFTEPCGRSTSDGFSAKTIPLKPDLQHSPAVVTTRSNPAARRGPRTPS
jgi:hypothetical protein